MARIVDRGRVALDVAGLLGRLRQLGQQRRAHGDGGSGRIAISISEVARASSISVEGTSQTNVASAEVARTAEELRTLVGSFRVS